MPSRLFGTFFPVAVLHFIAEFTNIYTNQYVLNYQDFGNNYGALAKTTEKEIYLELLMALMTFMGIVHLSALKQYWSSAPIYNSKHCV